MPESAKKSLDGRRRLLIALRPRATRNQLITGLVCVALGFLVVMQVQQTNKDQFYHLRQDDLVQLLDSANNRTQELEAEKIRLQQLEQELEVGYSDSAERLRVATENATTQGILSGRLPAEGPGITVKIWSSQDEVTAVKLFTVLEELRNSGAEVIALNGIRIGMNSYFVPGIEGVVVDGAPVSSPYVWQAIGDPKTLLPALEIPGGALASLRNAGATTQADSHEKLLIEAVRDVPQPKYATEIVE